ncbi:MAG TPA: patatin-like phospholipase family protein [Streptosporangiaceae bacterium]|nr:patatin-like phospholipase family protein [Streptosporangiaceae bacterium]
MEKALVLGGGGVTGIAWEIGLLAGLAQHGVDLTDADLVVGTSAGSVVGVDVRSGTSLPELYQVQTQPPGDKEIYARMGLGVMVKFVRTMLFSRKPEVARVRIGAMALRAKTESEQVRRRVIESRLPTLDWPPGRLQITAVDAFTGELKVFDAASGARLLDAVGASCAVPGIWPPVTINGRRYVDGGTQSAANADLAAGYDRVIIIAPLASGFGAMASPVQQARALSEAGARVAVIKPDKAALRAIGKNVLDPARRPAAALAGYAQAGSVTDQAERVWSA